MARSGESVRFVRVIAALGLSVMLTGCTATQKNLGGWFGEPTPTPSAKPKTTAATVVRKPTVYYAGVEGLKVYSEPSASSTVVGTLSLNEKVMRSKVERGFALIESTKSGAKGWVDNARLRWRPATVPATAAPAPEEMSPEEARPEEAPPEEPVVPAPEEAQQPAAPEPAATVAEPEPAATAVPSAPAGALNTSPPVGPSIFNPY
jgi:hypothetical protein